MDWPTIEGEDFMDDEELWRARAEALRARSEELDDALTRENDLASELQNVREANAILEQQLKAARSALEQIRLTLPDEERMLEDITDINLALDEAAGLAN